MRLIVVAAVVAMLLNGCAAKEPAAAAAPAGNDRWRETDEAVVRVLRQAAATRPSARFGVTHVVLCWLKTPGDAQQRRQLIETSHGFHTIPGVSLIAAGTPLPSTRPVVDASYDVAIVIMFEDEAALKAYDQHPQHREAVQKVLRPLTQKILIYDFRNQRP